MIHNGPNPTSAQIREELATEFALLKGGAAADFLNECVEPLRAGLRLRSSPA